MTQSFYLPNSNKFVEALKVYQESLSQLKRKNNSIEGEESRNVQPRINSQHINQTNNERDNIQEPANNKLEADQLNELEKAFPDNTQALANNPVLDNKAYQLDQLEKAFPDNTQALTNYPKSDKNKSTEDVLETQRYIMRMIAERGNDDKGVKGTLIQGIIEQLSSGVPLNNNEFKGCLRKLFENTGGGWVESSTLKTFVKLLKQIQASNPQMSGDIKQTLGIQDISTKGIKSALNSSGDFDIYRKLSESEKSNYYRLDTEWSKFKTKQLDKGIEALSNKVSDLGKGLVNAAASLMKSKKSENRESILHKIEELNESTKANTTILNALLKERDNLGNSFRSDVKSNMKFDNDLLIQDGQLKQEMSDAINRTITSGQKFLDTQQVDNLKREIPEIFKEQSIDPEVSSVSIVTSK